MYLLFKNSLRRPSVTPRHEMETMFEVKYRNRCLLNLLSELLAMSNRFCAILLQALTPRNGTHSLSPIPSKRRFDSFSDSSCIFPLASPDAPFVLVISSSHRHLRFLSVCHILWFHRPRTFYLAERCLNSSAKSDAFPRVDIAVATRRSRTALLRYIACTLWRSFRPSSVVYSTANDRRPNIREFNMRIREVQSCREQPMKRS